GTLKTIAKEGDVLPIGSVVCTIEGAGAAAPAAKPADATPAATTTPASSEKATTYASGTPSPAAAKILAEKGVEAGSVSGTGVAGRITKEDAVAAQTAPAKAPAAAPPAPAAAPASPAPAGERGERREKMSPLRKTVAKRLVQVKN